MSVKLIRKFQKNRKSCWRLTQNKKISVAYLCATALSFPKVERVMRLSITKAFALGIFKAPLGSSNMGNFKFGQHIRITVTLDLKFLCSTGTKIFKRAKSVILACSQYLCRTSLLCKLRPALLCVREHSQLNFRTILGQI